MYHVIRSSCSCHPETCSHWRYYVVYFDGTKVIGSDNEDTAHDYCMKLNKEII